MIIERWKCVSYCLCKISTTRGHFERSDEGAWVLYEEAKALEQDNERLRAALERITECIEYRDGGAGVQVISGSGHHFWDAIRDAKKITHSHERATEPQSGPT